MTDFKEKIVIPPISTDRYTIKEGGETILELFDDRMEIQQRVVYDYIDPEEGTTEQKEHRHVIIYNGSIGLFNWFYDFKEEVYALEIESSGSRFQFRLPDKKTGKELLRKLKEWKSAEKVKSVVRPGFLHNEEEMQQTFKKTVDFIERIDDENWPIPPAGNGEAGIKHGDPSAPSTQDWKNRKID